MFTMRFAMRAETSDAGERAGLYAALLDMCAWAEIGEYMLVDAAGYGRWNADRSGTASISFATTVAELQAERDQYQIITPSEAAEYVAKGIPLALQPLVGGIPPDVAWRYLEAAANVKERS